MSVLEMQKNNSKESKSKFEELKIEERTMIYYLVNLILLKQNNVAI